MNTNSTKNKFLFSALIISTMLSLVYGYTKKRENTELKAYLTKTIKEKDKIKKDISLLTSNYEKATHKNKKLSKRFVSEINKIIKLKDFVNSLDNNLKNDQEILTKKTILAAQLANKNNILSKKISEAQLLKINDVKIVKMRKKVSGRLTKTTNPKKIDAIKIDVQIQKNELATSGQKTFHLQLINSANEIISQKKQARINNKTLTCSDEIVFDYNNESIDIVSVVEVNRSELAIGEYKVKTFIDGKLITHDSFNID